MEERAGVSAPRAHEGADVVDKHWREKNRTVTRFAVWLDRQGHAGRLPSSLADRVCSWLDARYGMNTNGPVADDRDDPASDGAP
jgi:hypothetical protein